MTVTAPRRQTLPPRGEAEMTTHLKRVPTARARLTNGNPYEKMRSRSTIHALHIGHFSIPSAQLSQQQRWPH